MKTLLTAKRMRNRLLAGKEWEKDLDVVYFFDIAKQCYSLCGSDMDMSNVMMGGMFVTGKRGKLGIV